jgi:hypothetical protein
MSYLFEKLFRLEYYCGLYILNVRMLNSLMKLLILINSKRSENCIVFNKIPLKLGKINFNMTGLSRNEKKVLNK